MEILYGVDTDNDDAANFYVQPPMHVPDWAQVVSVRISLLVATIDNNLTTHRPFPLVSTAINTPADRRFRRVFTSTIALRNRLP